MAEIKLAMGFDRFDMLHYQTYNNSMGPNHSERDGSTTFDGKSTTRRISRALA